MTDLRKAAQAALEVLRDCRVFVTSKERIKHPEGTDWYDEQIAALRAALAEQDAEPVAWMTHSKDPLPLFHKTKAGAEAWGAEPQPLYTHPPRREWQGLTDEEIEVLMDTYDVASIEYARAIEAALKEKNT